MKNDGGRGKSERFKNMSRKLFVHKNQQLKYVKFRDIIYKFTDMLTNKLVVHEFIADEALSKRILHLSLRNIYIYIVISDAF